MVVVSSCRCSGKELVAVGNSVGAVAGWQISSEDMCSPNEVVSGTTSMRTWDSFYSTTMLLG